MTSHIAHCRHGHLLGALAALALLTGIASCADESPEDRRGPPTEVEISAERGGTVEAPGGEATVEFPPGALLHDTTVTIAGYSVGGDAARALASRAWEIGPAGLELAVPATITILTTTEVPPERQIALSRLGGDGRWAPVEGAGRHSDLPAGAAVSAEVTHFSVFGLAAQNGDEGNGGDNGPPPPERPLLGDQEWEQIPEAVTGNIGFRDFAFSGERHVLVGDRLNIRISDDGTQWTSGQVDGAGTLSAVAWGAAGFLAAGAGGYGDNDLILYRSQDGDAWEQVSPVMGDNLHGDGFDGEFFADRNDRCAALEFHDGYYFMATGSGRVFRSQDGARWELVFMTDGYRSDLMVVAGDELLLIPGYADLIFRSSNGVDWTTHEVTGPWDPDDGDSPYGLLRDVVWDGQRFLGVSFQRVLKSENGTHWEVVELADAELHSWDLLTAIAHHDGIYLAVGGNTQLPRNLIGRSDDGIHWLFEIEEPCTFCTSRLAHDGRDFIAYGPRLYAGKSRDGATWDISSVSLMGTADGVLYNGNTFLTFGDGGAVLTSEDAVSWTKRETGVEMDIRSGVWDGERFVLLASEEDGSGNVEGTLLTSEDGMEWHQEAVDGISLVLAWDGERYFLKGAFHSPTIYITTDFDDLALTEPGEVFRTMHYSDGVYLATTTRDIFYSENGVDWEEVHSGRGGWIRMIASGDPGFIAVGESRTLLSSLNGREWTERECPLPDAWVADRTSSGMDYRGAAWDGERFMAVGRLGRVIKSYDGVSWNVSETGRYGVNDNLGAVAGDATRQTAVAVGTFLVFRRGAN